MTAADWKPGDPLYEDWSVDTARAIASIQHDHPAAKCAPEDDRDGIHGCMSTGTYGSAARWPDPFPLQDLED